MAQTYLVGTTTRVHPNEWSSGAAAGALSSFILINDLSDVHEVFESNATINEIRQFSSRFTPNNWTIPDFPHTKWP